MTNLETAFLAEQEGICDIHYRAGEPEPTAADWDDFLSDRMEDIIECHDLEEDADSIYTYFTTRWAENT